MQKIVFYNLGKSGAVFTFEVNMCLFSKYLKLVINYTSQPIGVIFLKEHLKKIQHLGLTS